MQKKSCRYLLLYSPGGRTRREGGPASEVHLEPHFRGWDGRGGPAMLPFKRAMVFFPIDCPS